MVPIRFRSAPFPSFSANSSASAAKFWLSLALCALLPAAALKAEKPSPSPAKDAPKPAEAGKAAEEAEPADSTANMTAMMIQGQDVKGMRYEHRDENDKVVMEFESEVARKLDDENIEMENLKIIAFDEEGKKADILLPRSVFNVTTRILTGKDQIVIKRDDFEITGETGEFNTKTRFAKFIGDVKMIILNTENLDKNTENTDQ
jgi:hypothetical protein